MIAREGLLFIFIGLIVTVLSILAASRWNSSWMFGLSVLFGVLTLFVTFFFRDPQRDFTAGPGLLVSPADGKVIKIEQLPSHPFVGGPTTKVSIFLSVFDVHINRVPGSGVIDYVKYNPGTFHAAWADKASELNEQTDIGMTTESGQKIAFKQIAGLIARRIVCKLNERDIVKAGDRFGLIRFGPRTELFVPSATSVLVKVGDKVYGGQTPIAQLLVSPHVKQAAQGVGQHDN